jgi:hypothetical protein
MSNMLKRKLTTDEEEEFLFPPTKKKDIPPNFIYLFPKPHNSESLKFYITPRMAFLLYTECKFIYESMTHAVENINENINFFEILIPPFVLKNANKNWLTQFSYSFFQILDSLQQGIIPKSNCIADSIALYRVIVHSEIELRSGQFLKYFGDVYNTLPISNDSMDLKFAELYEFFFILDNFDFFDFIEYEDDSLNLTDINHWFKPYS